MDFWKFVIRRQFNAALDMVANAIDACPEDVWAAAGTPCFWALAFHTLFWTDLYLSGEDEPGFRPPPQFGLTELEECVAPGRVYTKDELQTYVRHCHDRVELMTAGMTENWAASTCPVAYRAMSNGELLLYNLRHVQHHAAQLNLLLRQQTGSAPRWVSKGGQRQSGSQG